MRTKYDRKISTYLGIDPGKSGAACMLLPDFSLKFIDWPKSDNLQEIYQSMRVWRFHYKISFSVMEKVASMSGQGVSSTFAFGQNYGAWKMLLTALDIRYHLLMPSAWQKGLMTKTDGPDPKSRVKNVATRLFSSKYFFGPRGGYKDGRGDAALMAFKARQMYLKGDL